MQPWGMNEMRRNNRAKLRELDLEHQVQNRFGFDPRHRRTSHTRKNTINEPALVHRLPQHRQRQLRRLLPADFFAALKFRRVRYQQTELLCVNRQGVLAPQVSLVEISERDVQSKIVETKLHGIVAYELNVNA